MPALSDVAKKSLSSGDGNVTVEIWTLFAIGVCATLLRMYSRLSIMSFRDLRADDLLVWVGVVRPSLKSISSLRAKCSYSTNHHLIDLLRRSVRPGI